jgi:Carbon starvation protein CstA
MGTLTDTTGRQTKILWIGVAVLGAVSFGIVALTRGEAVNAAWLVVAAVCVYFIAYRFYGLFVANRALGVHLLAQMTPSTSTTNTPPVTVA